MFDIPDGAIYREDEIFEAIKQIAKKPSEDKLLVDFKGELVTVCELLDRISEKEFLTILNIHANGLDNYTNISREYLNNGAIIYLHAGNLSGRRINKFFENNIREEMLVKFNPTELKLFIKNHPNVYAVRTARKNTNIIRVDVDDNDNRIAGFKKCDLIITSKESLQEYLHDTKNINDYNGNLSNVYNYSVNINLSTVGTNGEVVYFYDIYRHKETGNIYISLKDKPFHYPIPLNFKFD